MDKQSAINLTKKYVSCSVAQHQGLPDRYCLWLRQLASRMADLRTSIYSIHGMAEVLALGKPSADIVNSVVTITQSSDMLLEQINKLVAVVRLMAGDVVIQSQQFDLQNLIEQTGKTWAMRAHAKGIEFIIDYALTSPTCFVGDAQQIQQILDNLLANALATTEQGHIQISLTFNGQTSAITLLVADTRQGFTEKLLQEIFSDIAPNDALVGSDMSLDLPFVKGLVELMGGELYVELEHGCCFSCVLPLTPVTQPKDLAHAWPTHGIKPQVMIIDDNKVRGAMLQDLMHDFNAVWVTGDKAVETMRQEDKQDCKFPIVIIDQQLNSVDVRSITRVIVSQLCATAPMLVALTQQTDMKTTELLQAAGYSLCIPKPISQAHVVKKLFASWQQWLMENSQPTAEHKSNKAKILVVEDNTQNQRVATHFLQALGCAVDIIDCGEKALALANNDYDLIFMDVILPGICGLTATSRIRQQEDKQKQPIPIVGLTAQYLESDKARYDAAGMNEVLTKPVTLNEMEDVLVRWIPFMQKRAPENTDK